MKKLVSLLLSVLMLTSLLTFTGCDEGDINDYLIENGINVSVSDIIINENGDNVGDNVSDDGDMLPDAVIGSWTPTAIYQEAAASDITSDTALSLETEHGVSFGYGDFRRYGDELNGASFAINDQASFEDMKALGIQTASLVDKHGSDAKVTAISVYTENGDYCTTAFLINDTTLVAFGAGMNVFTYEKMEAVG